MHEIVFAALSREVYQKLMRRRMCIVAVGMLIGFAIVRIATPSSEPSADGKPLSFWLEQLEREGQGTPPPTEATAAVRKIGTNALPWLLSEMRQKDSALKSKWVKMVAGKPPYNSWVKSAWEDQPRALLGYAALKEMARPAATDLIALLAQEPHGYASKALVLIGESSLGALTNSLTHPDPQFRAAIADTLQEFKAIGKPAIPALLERLRDPNAIVRTASANALGQLNADQKVVAPALLPLLKDPSPNVRVATIWAIIQTDCGDETTVNPLLDLLDDQKCAEPALFALERIGCRGETVVPILLERLEKTDTWFRAPMISCLGGFPAQHQTILPVLMRAATETNTWSRCAAVASLAKFKRQPDLVLPALIQRLEDPESAVRYAAADGVGEFGKLASAAIPALKRLQKDQTLVPGGCFPPAVSEAANRAVAQIEVRAPSDSQTR